MPEPEKSERDPPEMERSDSTKSMDGSERMNESVAVSPALSEEVSEPIVMVGLTVSTVRVTELLSSEPSSLNRPELEKVLLATLISPFDVLLDKGVKMVV